MANLNISTGIGNNGGIVTSTNTSQLNIVTQPSAAGWNAPNTPAQTVRNINSITVHYTGWHADGPQTATLTQFNNWWGDHTRSSGYHFIIQANGTVWQTTRISKVAYGAAGPTNTNNIHIALVGLFWDGVSERSRRNNGTLISGVHHMSAGQQTALQRLVQGFISNTNLPAINGIERVFGHRHLPNATYCPGYTLNNLRARITPALPQSTIPGTFRVSRGNTFVGTAPNAGRIATIGIGGTFLRTGEMQVAGNWTWLRGRLTGTSVNPNTLVWIATSQLERHAGTNGIQCQITDPQRFRFTSVRNIPGGPNIFNFTGNAMFRPVGHSITAGGFSWRLGTILNSNISALNGTTAWVASTQFAANSHTACR